MNRHSLALLLLLGVVTTAQTPPQTNPLKPVQDEAALAAARRTLAEAVIKSLDGRENQPARAVFSNVKALPESVTAGQLVRAMEMTFSPALGVSCDYCHSIGDFGSDALPAKKIAREMIRMNGLINGELAKIPDVPRGRNIGCWTCHRGGTKPPQAPPK